MAFGSGTTSIGSDGSRHHGSKYGGGGRDDYKKPNSNGSGSN